MVVGETYSFVDQTFERLTILYACTTVPAFDHSFKSTHIESAIGSILIVARHALFFQDGIDQIFKDKQGIGLRAFGLGEGYYRDFLLDIGKIFEKVVLTVGHFSTKMTGNDQQ